MAPHYDCSKCPAYCCSYEHIGVSSRDIKRLAKHFGIDAETAAARFTKKTKDGPVLRHQKDEIYGQRVQTQVLVGQEQLCHELRRRRVVHADDEDGSIA